MKETNKQTCVKCYYENEPDVLCCALCGWSIESSSSNVCSSVSEESVGTMNVQADDETIAPIQSAITDSDNSYCGSQLFLGRRLTHFEIIEILGQGGMGAVYRARDLILERFVAVKLFRSDTGTTENSSQLLLDEARMACKLNHPNIVTIYDIVREEQNSFIVMEWVEGCSLEDLIPEKGLPLEKALDFACQIADGILCAHQNGIIHRDIKPHNIMVTSQGRIKILDFGIAGLLQQQEEFPERDGEIDTPIDHDITNIGSHVGTPVYMSPEQMLGQVLDQRTDIFSFGIVLYQMLCGHRPYDGKTSDALRIAMTTGDYVPVEQYHPEIPEPLIDLISQMIASDKCDRLQTSKELSNSIHTIYNDLIENKNWWQRRNLVSKMAIVLPLIFVLGWSVREILFPPSTQELIERQLANVTKVAVLPFENTSGDPMLKIFSEGLSSAINNDLISISESRQDLWVVPYSEVNKVEDISSEKVNKLFGVGFAINGSIENLGNQHRLTISIVDTKQVRVLKRKTLLIDEGTLFSEQSRILDQIVRLLGWEIDLDNTIADNREPPIGAAYRHYLNGLGFLYRDGGSKNLQNAIDEFKQSILIDKKLYEAFFSLSEAYVEKHGDSKAAEDLIQAQNYA